jgi:hypothetical protein
MNWVTIASSLPFRVAGVTLAVLVSIIGVRMLFYWWSVFMRNGRYRARVPVSSAQLRLTSGIPYCKVQWTTKGSPGSTEVVLRGIRQVEDLVYEDPRFYQKFVSAEVVTENAEQAELITNVFRNSPLPVCCVVTPADYQTPKHTGLKARQMHYLVELRRRGWNRKPGKTFIIHFDEDTLMVPSEFRKMIACLSATDRSILTGPIYYPLEHLDATRLARATEASRPITCFECRRVMETGIPLHIHGSNVAVEEEFENWIGWDIGELNGTPFVAEDYMFGMESFVRAGRQAFGWHGCVALEQPPFSFPSVFRQRYRWVFGVLQGMYVHTRVEGFRHLPLWLRWKVIWGTRYRIFTYGSGGVVGALSLLYMVAWLYVAQARLRAGLGLGVPAWLSAWFAVVGFMWLGSNLIGGYLNTMGSAMSPLRRLEEITRAVVVTPVVGVMENSAAIKAVAMWAAGHRGMEWKVTPSTKAADDTVNGRIAGQQAPLALTVTEARMPSHQKRAEGNLIITSGTVLTAALITCVYIGVPLTGFIQDTIAGQQRILGPAILAACAIVAVLGIIGMVIQRTAEPARTRARHAIPRHVAHPRPAAARITASQLEDLYATDVMVPVGYYDR